VSSKKITPEETVVETKHQEIKKFPWPTVLSWGVTVLVVAVLLLVLFQKIPLPGDIAAEEITTTVTPIAVDLPVLQSDQKTDVEALIRKPNMDTIIPEGTRKDVVKYTVVAGDSIFSIATTYGLKPESVIWANDDYFGGNPTVTLSIGVVLNIPPTNGVLYTWKDGDTLKKVAYDYNSTVQKIVAWPANHLDAADPVVEPGTMIMIPDGSTVINEWIQEVAYTPRSGVTKTIAGPGGCAIVGGYGAVGSMNFQWPSSQHAVSGWDFTSFHKGIDIAVYLGEPVYASDAGTVVYAGWNDTGYGYMVMIDHNNGYQTLYAHLSGVAVSCGSNVAQLQLIGYAGSTGNSTGPHLHFEVRRDGGFLNPWYVLP
jgi:murein DD-endopeptidase MepM/ murein hydrolase activator NlpD